MRELKKSFIGIGEVKESLFTQVAKNDYGFIYSVTFPNYDKLDEWQNEPHHFEVFKRKISSGFDFANKVATDEKIEVYPKSNNFGDWAKTCYTLERAKEILNSYL